MKLSHVETMPYRPARASHVIAALLKWRWTARRARDVVFTSKPSAGDGKQRRGIRVRRKNQGRGPVVIKKYANRRLYNTQTSSYVTLDHLAAMVKEGTEFEVQDARTGEDITRSVLTQIIFEEEAKGQNLLPIKFLRQLIRFYGDSLQAFVPGYLDMSMDSFTKNQGAMRDRIAEALGGGNQMIENLTRQNLAMFERAMQMFSPFGAARPEPQDGRAVRRKAGLKRCGSPKAGDGSDAPPDFRTQSAEIETA